MKEYVDRSTKSWYVYVYTAKLCGPLLAGKWKGIMGGMAQITKDAVDARHVSTVRLSLLGTRQSRPLLTA